MNSDRLEIPKYNRVSCPSFDVNRIEDAPRLYRRPLSPKTASERCIRHNTSPSSPILKQKSLSSIGQQYLLDTSQYDRKSSNKHKLPPRRKWGISYQEHISNATFPRTPRDSNNEIDNIKDMLEYLMANNIEEEQQTSSDDGVAAIIRIQKIVRGTLARWNCSVLKLQYKLQQIHATKERQLKKIQQRKVQQKRSLKNRREFQEEHRIIRRRLRRVKCIRNHYQKEKIMALEENQGLKSRNIALIKQNEECARLLGLSIQDIEVAHKEIASLKQVQQQWQNQFNIYQAVVQALQEAIKEQDP
jgi:hypothetical protein